MKWPWTSRARLSDAQNEITELKAEVKELRIKNERLLNQIVWRSSAVALDPDLLPEHYRPKTVTPEQNKGDALNDPPVRSTITGSGSMRARQTIREAEATRQAEFQRKTAGVGGPVVETEADRRAKLELLSGLNQAADEGMEAAKGA